MSRWRSQASSSSLETVRWKEQNLHGVQFKLAIAAIVVERRTYVESFCRISKLRMIWNASQEPSLPTSSSCTLKGDFRDVSSTCERGKVMERSKSIST